MTQGTAFVLAAGFGTRLRPLTDHRPKALVPVCGVPLLAYSLALCLRHGHREVVVNAHHHVEQLRAWAGNRGGLRVTVSEEAEILGTGGGLRHAAGLLAERFAIVNADVLCDVDLRRLIAAVPHGGAAMALRTVPGDPGRVATDASGHVVGLRAYEGPSSGDVVWGAQFTGVHAMDRAALQGIAAGFSDVIDAVYARLLAERRVVAHRHDGLWLDVGDPAAYLDANLAVLDGTPLALDPADHAAWSRGPRGERGDSEVIAGAIVDGPAWIGFSAQVEGATLRRSVVGDRAVVPPGASLVDCVVWDGTTVPEGTHHRTIFHEGGVLRL